MSPTLSVVVPTLNAEGEIGQLLSSIEQQTIKPIEILVVDSSSDDGTCDEVKKHPDASLCIIERSSFNHGSTRDMALRRTAGDIVCFLTQDAMPDGPQYLENLIRPMLNDSLVALSSGRQLPKSDARRFEQLVREFNYPDISTVRSSEDLQTLGIKTFFCSDVCSAYRRDAYLSCGGFQRVDTNEDMLMAARFISKGYKVAYEATACVYHSHNLSPRQQFERNKTVGHFLELHSEDLMGVNEIGEGGKLVKRVSTTLIREGRIGEFFAFGVDCAARLIGNRVGRSEARKETSA
jgi:rhamnosyltransferase